MIIYEEILRKFHDRQVKYIIVGGIALNLLGSVRNTLDLDIMVELSDENLSKIVPILTGHGYRVKQPVDPMGIADRSTREDWINNKHMKAFNFYKDEGLKEIDIIIESPLSFQEAVKTAEFITCDDLKLPVISIDNLIAMKKYSGRKIDDIDIDQLTHLKKLRKQQQ